MEGVIDFRALEKELEEAIAADEKYQRENEAKFRAVHQKVATYEEFRDIVLASHLRPLEKKDKVGKKRNVLWNSHAVKANLKQESEVQLSQELEQLPKTSAEFYRDWRRCMKNSQERYQLLLQLGSQNLGQIFQTDLAFGFLGEFLAVFNENTCLKDRDSVLEILESFSGTKRFGLNVELMSEQEKKNCRQLFEKLQRMGTDPSNPPDFSHATEGEGVPGTQIHCQADGPTKIKLMELMHLYKVT
ncbi:coiled-coil domain-containing protein 103 [Podarcis raffonei]|uniref:coiled-coil domain-containing protein 103 n=1 Tax=Podarcis raffonei TaxID=65483 RepID=UPI00232926BD|nr:coiled-coil domain-containing protein 103 [Podarcis raffonei]XP_053217949.1 coiled-coil domain-containing protein 103 [Podarcis raffonei]